MAAPLDPTSVKPARPDAQKTRKVLVKKAKQGANTNKYIWLAGHASTLIFGAVYLVFYSLRWVIRSWYWTPRICYRLAFIGVLMSYSMTIVTTFGGIVPGYHTLLATENFQNLILACIWLISRPSAFKLFPYYAIALLQVSKHFNIKLILNLQDRFSDAIAACEIGVIFALLFDTLLFRGTSGFALAIYLMFYWLRINFSPYTQAYILRIVTLIDEKVMVKQKPEIKEKWQKFKDFVEFRRAQTSEMYEKHMDHEPEVVAESTHENAGKVIEDGEHLDVSGDQETVGAKGVPEGVNVDEMNRKLGNSTTSTSGTTTNTSSTSRTPPTQANTQRQAPQPQPGATAGFIPATTTIPSQSATNANTIPQTSPPSGRIAVPEVITQGTTQDTTTKATAQVQPSIAQASGRISAPGSPSPSKQHSLDPRQKLIDHAQKIKTASQEDVDGVKQSAQTELQKVQQAAQEQIASTQGGN